MRGEPYWTRKPDGRPYINLRSYGKGRMSLLTAEVIEKYGIKPSDDVCEKLFAEIMNDLPGFIEKRAMARNEKKSKAEARTDLRIAEEKYRRRYGAEFSLAGLPEMIKKLKREPQEFPENHSKRIDEFVLRCAEIAVGDCGESVDDRHNLYRKLYLEITALKNLIREISEKRKSFDILLLTDMSRYRVSNLDLEMKYRKVPSPFMSVPFRPQDDRGLPDISGIYFLWGVSGDVEYVGQSVNIRKRIIFGKHDSLKVGDKISWIEFPECMLNFAECFYIGALCPCRNFKPTKRNQELMSHWDLTNLCREFFGSDITSGPEWAIIEAI